MHPACFWQHQESVARSHQQIQRSCWRAKALITICRFTTKEAWQALLKGTTFKEFSAWFDASGIEAERAARCYNETALGLGER